MKLLLDKAARFYRVLVLGNVSEKDRKALAGGERIDRIPNIAVSAARFERGRALLRHGLGKLTENLMFGGFRKGLPQFRAGEIAPLRDLRPGPPVEIADVPVPV